MAHTGNSHTGGQSKKGIQFAHPGRVAACQIIVHRYHLNTFTRQCIQVGKQGGNQCLTFTGAHFRDLAFVQNHAADELHVKMAHTQHALGPLADSREGLRQQAVQRRTVGQALAELLGLRPERFVGQSRHIVLEPTAGQTEPQEDSRRGQMPGDRGDGQSAVVQVAEELMDVLCVQIGNYLDAAPGQETRQIREVSVICLQRVLRETAFDA